MRHNIEVVIDRLVISPTGRARLAESVELGLKVGGGGIIIAPEEKSSDKSGEKSSEKNGTTNKARQLQNVDDDEEAAELNDEDEADAKSRNTKSAKSTDMILSCDYACTHCGVSFDAPTPQLFSFNSPQGMCLGCSGLGEVFTFDSKLLVPDPTLSFKDGAIELVGKWKEMGRWRRHIYQGVADTMERLNDWEEGTLLEAPWKKLTPTQQAIWLRGTRTPTSM